MPLGITLEGTVTRVRKVGLGFVHETALVDVDLERLVLADGTVIPLKTRVTQVENARETVDKKGNVQGIRSTSTLSHRARAGIVGTLAFGDPIAAIFTTAASTSVLRFSEPEISFPAGTEMIAQLTSPIELPQENVQGRAVRSPTRRRTKRLCAAWFGSCRFAPTPITPTFHPI